MQRTGFSPITVLLREFQHDRFETETQVPSWTCAYHAHLYDIIDKNKSAQVRAPPDVFRGSWSTKKSPVYYTGSLQAVRACCSACAVHTVSPELLPSDHLRLRSCWPPSALPSQLESTVWRNWEYIRWLTTVIDRRAKNSRIAGGGRQSETAKTAVKTLQTRGTPLDFEGDGFPWVVGPGRGCGGFVLSFHDPIPNPASKDSASFRPCTDVTKLSQDFGRCRSTYRTQQLSRPRSPSLWVLG